MYCAPPNLETWLRACRSNCCICYYC